jgi:hypothetical protein
LPEPIVTSISVTKPILSDEIEFQSGNVRFTFDQDIVAYSVKCVGTSYNTGRNVEEGDKYVPTQAINYTVAEASSISVREFAVIPAETLISAEINYVELYQEGENRVNVYGKSVDGIWSTYNQQQEVIITTENINFIGKTKGDLDDTRRVDYYTTSTDQILPIAYGDTNEISTTNYRGLDDYNDGLNVEYTSSSGLTEVQFMFSFQVANIENVKSVTFQIVGQFDQPFRADFYNNTTGNWDIATRLNFDGYTMGVLEKKLDVFSDYHENGKFRICVQSVLDGVFGLDYANLVIEREGVI